jgi:hypothetical protein
VNIDPDGGVRIEGRVPDEAWLSLDGITFRAAN